ncbi:MAG: hypothetical protein E4H14_19670 [Candidatus Thorarchaeota archaeon]|nr:MAG: hypothetical protein E4H14_19670 [Candidatus Thorarchaeota archaeon]
MNSTVYVLVAGLNQTVRNWEGVSPPLIDNCFQIAFRMRKFSDDFYLSKLDDVFSYIEKYWKRSRQSLASEPFNIEECFTLIELQRREASVTGRSQDEDSLYQVQFKLKSFLAELLSDFAVFSNSSPEMHRLGQILWNEKPTILTFNYDTILESIIELASGHSEDFTPHLLGEFFRKEVDGSGDAPDELLSSSFNRWKRPLGYGILFNEVKLPHVGPAIIQDGKRYYDLPSNKLYTWPILKLHGSINWFRYLPIRSMPTFPGEDEPIFSDEISKRTLLIEGSWWFTEPPRHNGWYLDPVMITPDLNKEEKLHHPVFTAIWDRARNSLSECKRLIIIGYAFSTADFPTKKLFLEAFVQNTLDELIVVNPDTSVVKTVKDLCHFQKPVVVCKDIAEFLRMYDQPGNIGIDELIRLMRFRESPDKGTQEGQLPPTP